MAFTFTPGHNGWEHAYTFDDNLHLRSSGTAISTDTTGTAISSGFECGNIYSLLVNIASADYTTGDEEYFIWIQYSEDSSNWYDIQGACIKPVLKGTSPDEYYELEESVFKVPDSTVYLRYRVDVEGVTPSIDLDIYLALAP